MNFERRRITQHKRFVPYGTHPNSAFGGTSFMLETLEKNLLFISPSGNPLLTPSQFPIISKPCYVFGYWHG